MKITFKDLQVGDEAIMGNCGQIRVFTVLRITEKGWKISYESKKWVCFSKWEDYIKEGYIYPYKDTPVWLIRRRID